MMKWERQNSLDYIVLWDEAGIMLLQRTKETGQQILSSGQYSEVKQQIKDK